MIDFNYTAPELLPLRIQEVLDAPNEPHRIGGVVYVPATWQRSRHHELFGTPERAARTLSVTPKCFEPETACRECIYKSYCDTQCDYDALLEWLGGDVE